MRKIRVAAGFTLIELVVVVVIVSVLAYMLLSRALFYEEQAEKTAMEQTVGTLRSALHLQIADRIVHGRMQELAQLAGDNPMNWLAEKPKNYLGEYYAPKLGQVAEGNWYFDASNHTLVYLPVNQAHLETAVGEANKIRFQSKLLKSSSVAINEPDSRAAQESIEGVLLEPVKPYKWF